jgi:hypothetical protein
MRPWWIGLAALLSFLSHGPGAVFAGSCLISGPRYQLATDIVDWSMKVASGQSCTRGLRFNNVAIEYPKLVSSPQSGEVTLKGPSFTYTAKSDFQGQDSFAIVISGSINRIRGSSTIHVNVLVGNAPTPVHIQAQDNSPAQVEATNSVPAATQKATIQVNEPNETLRNPALNNAKNMKVNWSPGIGDLTIAGWLTAALYFMASANCWILARKIGLEDANRSRERDAWRSIAAIFLVLGINQVLGLDTGVAEAGRKLANYQGWYHQRRPVQISFIALVAVTCLVAAISLLIWVRHASFSTRFALVGTMLILSFVLIRADSLHQVDRLLAQRVFGFRWNWVLEMGGIAFVLLASQWRQVGLADATRCRGKSSR